MLFERNVIDDENHDSLILHCNFKQYIYSFENMNLSCNQLIVCFLNSLLYLILIKANMVSFDQQVAGFSFEGRPMNELF